MTTYPHLSAILSPDGMTELRRFVREVVAAPVAATSDTDAVCEAPKERPSKAERLRALAEEANAAGLYGTAATCRTALVHGAKALETWLANGTIVGVARTYIQRAIAILDEPDPPPPVMPLPRRSGPDADAKMWLVYHLGGGIEPWLGSNGWAERPTEAGPVTHNAAERLLDEWRKRLLGHLSVVRAPIDHPAPTADNARATLDAVLDALGIPGALHPITAARGIAEQLKAATLGMHEATQNWNKLATDVATIQRHVAEAATGLDALAIDVANVAPATVAVRLGQWATGLRKVAGVEVAGG